MFNMYVAEVACMHVLVAVLDHRLGFQSFRNISETQMLKEQTVQKG